MLMPHAKAQRRKEKRKEAGALAEARSFSLCDLASLREALSDLSAIQD